MYLPGQIVHDLLTGLPVKVVNVWDLGWCRQHPYTRHYIRDMGGYPPVYELFTPRSVEQAVSLLSVGIIAPAPFPTKTHCWRCQNWHDNCRAYGCLEGKTQA